MAENVLEKIVQTKRLEIEKLKASTSLDELQKNAANAPAPRDFYSAIANHRQMALIAEVKKASPSQGIIREDFDPIQIAKIYQQNGASCISVLTDEIYFQGKLEYLQDVRQSVQIPVLRKDFILDTWQVYEARAAGADAVLLIAECLDQDTLPELRQLVESLGMTALVEFYEPENIEKVKASGARLVGCNNRNLRSFETSLNHSIEMIQHFPADVPFVAESGIFTHDDVTRLQKHGIRGILVGQSLMEQQEIGKAVRDLLGTAN